MKTEQGLSRAWYAAVFLLGISAYWWATDLIDVTFLPGIFLPLLITWLAFRYSDNLASLWLWLGFLTVISINYGLADNLSLGVGHSTLFLLLAIIGVYAVSRPLPANGVSQFLNHRWTWCRWLTPMALWVSVYIQKWPEFEVGDTVSISFQLGFLLLAVILAVSIDREAVASMLRAHVVTSGRRQKWIRVAALAVLAVAIVVNLEWEYEYRFTLYFGFADGFDLVLAVAVALTLFGFVDWRVTVAALIAFFALEWPIFWAVEYIEAAIESMGTNTLPPGDSISEPGVIEEIVVTAAFRDGLYLRDWFWDGAVYGASAVLAAAAVTPFARTRKLDSLFTRRANTFFAGTLIVLFAAAPLVTFGLGNIGLFLVGILAFLCGLRWKWRGLLLSPFLFQFAYLFASFVFSYEEYELYGAIIYSVTIALYAFVFCYFGVLSNRMLPISPSADPVTGDTP